MVPLHKIETFRGARDFFGPLNGTSDSEGHFFWGSEKSRTGTGHSCHQKPKPSRETVALNSKLFLKGEQYLTLTHFLGLI
jgi:hypothetical protein